MSIENILESGNIEDVVAFLTAFIPTLDYNDYKKNNIESQLDFKSITERAYKKPNTYLDSVCVPAAEILRKKNIFVVGSVRAEVYTYLLFDKLNQENMKIFKDKYAQNNKNYFIDHGNLDLFGIRVQNGTKKKTREFTRLVSDFKMQDIQRGFLTEKGFLMNVCDCEKVEGLKEFKFAEPQIVFDVEKMDKSFREYLKDSGYEQYYVQDEHRVYMNDFYFKAHQNYLNEFKN